MFDELEKEMKRRRLSTVLVVGESTFCNPELAYVAGTAITRGGIFIKRRGQEPFLVVSNVDIANARQGRIRKVRTYSDYGFEKLVERHGRERGYILFIDAILRSVRGKGRLSMYGHNELSRFLSVADDLRKLGYSVIGEGDSPLIESLRETKDPLEISWIRSVGVRATRVVNAVLDMLRECKISSGKLWWKRQALTVGMVKSKISIMLAEQDLMAPEGTIFAVGRSSADPHEAGHSSSPVKVATPIVFDLFPVGLNGYWFDLTRTFVVGKAQPLVKRMFEAVLEVQLHSLDLIREGLLAREVMNSACDLFERRGFKTVRNMLTGDRQAAKVGFVHSLGHGVGLTIGEKPYLSLFSDDRLRTNQIMTVEPGLYDPGVGGVRIEDTVLVKGRRIINLTPLEKELEI